MEDSKLRAPLRDVPDVAQTSRGLKHGRRVVIRNGPQGETVQVRSPSGDVEVEIRITEDGPVVRLSGARVELEASESIDLRCKRFEVEATEDVTVTSGGKLTLSSQDDLDVEAGGDYRCTAEVIWLN